ncbi:hypothetical protein RFI_38071, partial [Reticulomyxa filosa]
KKRKEEIRKFFFQKKQNKTKTYIVSNAAVAGTRAACVELSNTLVDAASKTEIGQKIQNDQSEEMKTAKEVGKVTLQGILSIYKELDAAALVLIGEVADAGADVAKYKYDDEVGEVADETATIAKNSAAVSTNMGHLSLQQFADTLTRSHCRKEVDRFELYWCGCDCCMSDYSTKIVYGQRDLALSKCTMTIGKINFSVEIIFHLPVSSLHFNPNNSSK